MHGREGVSMQKPTTEREAFQNKTWDARPEWRNTQEFNVKLQEIFKNNWVLKKQVEFRGNLLEAYFFYNFHSYF